MKTAKCFMVLLMLSIMLCTIVSAKELKFTTNQTEYYFLVGNAAEITLNISNDYNELLDGMATYTTTQTVNTGNFQSRQSSTKSTNMQIGVDPLIMGFGTSDQPMDIALDFQFTFDEPSSNARATTQINGIIIHFVQSQTQQNSQQKTSTQQNSQQSNQQGQQNQQSNAPQEPKKPENPDTSTKMQNSQQGQDMNSVKSEMEKQMLEQQKMDNEFKNALAQNKDLQQEHQKMLDQGYKQTDSVTDAQNNNTGDFELEYRKNDSSGMPTTEKIKGTMENGKLTNMTNTMDIKKQLEQNNEYQELAKQLKDKGFSQSNINGNKNEFTQEFSDKYNNTVTLSGKGNLSQIKKFGIEQKLANHYIFDLLRNDKKFNSIENDLLKNNYTSDYSIKGNYIEFTNKKVDENDNNIDNNGKKKIYFETPQIIEKKINFFKSVQKDILDGWRYLFHRS